VTHEGRVVAFYGSATGSILREEAASKLRRNQPEEVPVIVLGRLAVNLKHKRHGLGAALLKHFMLKALQIADSVGVRLVVVHAKDDEAKSFYQHFDFIESSLNDTVLMMLLPCNKP
jgi:predicted N-acetyltransferase YhbS